MNLSQLALEVCGQKGGIHALRLQKQRRALEKHAFNLIHFPTLLCTYSSPRQL